VYKRQTSVDWEILAGGTLEAEVKPSGGTPVEELSGANH
jgi:hypothetical protein